MKTKNSGSKLFAPFAVLLAGGLGLCPMAHGELLYGLTTANNLLSFDSSSPGSIASVPISGLGGDSLRGIDIRPLNGSLFGVSSSQRLFTINPLTGLATVVGAASFSTSLLGTVHGFDFNPTVDRIRLVTDQAENLRLNPATGGLAATDGTLAYAVGDSNFGLDPSLAGAAYNNNFSGAGSTSLFVIDWMLDILALQNPANSGVLTTIGGLGFNTTGNVGFDISGVTGTAYASLTRPGAAGSQLFQINLGTGTASLLGTIGGGEHLLGLAATVPEPGVLALSALGVGIAVLMRRRRGAS